MNFYLFYAILLSTFTSQCTTPNVIQKMSEKWCRKVDMTWQPRYEIHIYRYILKMKSCYLIRRFGILRNIKCVSQTRKTWFYYDYIRTPTARQTGKSLYYHLMKQFEQKNTQKMWSLLLHIYESTLVSLFVSRCEMKIPRSLMKYDSNYIRNTKYRIASTHKMPFFHCLVFWNEGNYQLGVMKTIGSVERNLRCIPKCKIDWFSIYT